jgi:cellulose synthase/poly-beta-1,6-N-acetylglucosamine synthase-like glycosyltransferase
VTDSLIRAVAATDWAVLVYFCLVNLSQAALLASAAFELREHNREARGPTQRLVSTPLIPRVTVLVPAHNEEAVIVQTVTSALALDYPDLEVVVVNDGSTDNTLGSLIQRYELRPEPRPAPRALSTAPVRAVYASAIHPGLIVIDKTNGGKADALNAAISYATGSLVCSIDADTVIEPDALDLLVRPFINNDETIAAGGTVRVANGCELRHARVVDRRAPRNWLAAIQAIEYPRAFLFGRLGWNRLGGNVIISGAFGLFDRDLILRAGGYAEDTVGEDMELVLRLRRVAYEEGRRHRVFFLPNPVAWTEAPETVRTLARQRNRWHRGLADVLWRHRRVIGRPKYGVMGTVVLPYYFLLELLAPVVEALALTALVVGLVIGAIDVEFALLFALLAYGFGLLLSMAALAMEDRAEAIPLRLGDRLRQIRWILVEQFGYRQATVVWRLWGLTGLLRKDQRWGSQTRRGFITADESVPAS